MWLAQSMTGLLEQRQVNIELSSFNLIELTGLVY